MENDAGLHDKDANNLGLQHSSCAILHTDSAHLASLVNDNPGANVLYEKRQEETGHDDGRSGALIAEIANTLIGEHQSSVTVQLRIVSRGLNL